MLGAALLVLVWLAVARSTLPPVAFFGGLRFAQKAVALRAFERAGPVEVLVVGPSHVDQGFDALTFAEETGLRTFDLGVQGTDLYFQSLLLRRLLDEGRRPRAVLWALRDEALSRSNINRQYLAAPALAGTAPLAGWLGLAAGFWLPQYQRRSVSGWFDALVHGESEPLDAGGRVQLAGATRQERRRALHGAGEPADEPDGAVLDEDEDEGDDGDEARGGFLGADYAVDLATAQAHVAGTIERLRDLGIDVWLLLTPYNQAVLRRRTGYARQLFTGELEPYHAWVRALARENGCTLLDLRACAEISPRPELFFDSRHLNGAGAVVLGRLVGELFAGKRPLPAAWTGLPAPAEFETVLGIPALATAPRVPAGERAALDRARLERRDGRVLSLLVDVEVPRPGRYRAVLMDDAPRGHRTSLFARLGDLPYAVHDVAGASAGEVVAEADLTAGLQRLEVHVREGEPLDWDAWTVIPVR